MDSEKTTEMFMKLMEEIHQNTSALKDMLANHETRITVLETKKTDDWKTQLLMLLGKAAVIGLVTIASLTGASGLVAKVLNIQTTPVVQQQAK